jgi:hypothetical protein
LLAFDPVHFLSDHALTLHPEGGDYGYMVHWCRASRPGQPPRFYPVSNGKTAEEAIDKAIARSNRKDGIKLSVEVAAVLLEFRGWVS